MIYDKIAQKDRLREAIDYFSDYPKPFSLQSFMEWTENNIAGSECYDFLKNDSKFVTLTKSYLGNEVAFISELLLFRWWLFLNLRLSEPHINKTVLTRQELSKAMSSFTGTVEWTEFHNKVVEYGEKFGLVFYNTLCSCYAFPLAHLFSHIRHHYELDIQSLYNEFKSIEEKNIILQMSFPETLIQSMSNLKNRESLIIEYRFLRNKMTLDEIGSKLQITRERVRQIEKGTLNKIPVSLVLRIFLAEFIRKSGRLLIEVNSNSTLYTRFMKSFFRDTLYLNVKRTDIFFWHR